MNIPKVFNVNGKKAVLEGELFGVNGRKIFAVIDFDRNFDDPDLEALPASISIANSLQEEYLIKKYNIVIGEVN